MDYVARALRVFEEWDAATPGPERHGSTGVRIIARAIKEAVEEAWPEEPTLEMVNSASPALTTLDFDFWNGPEVARDVYKDLRAAAIRARGGEDADSA